MAAGDGVVYVASPTVFPGLLVPMINAEGQYDERVPLRYGRHSLRVANLIDCKRGIVILLRMCSRNNRITTAGPQADVHVTDLVKGDSLRAGALSARRRYPTTGCRILGRHWVGGDVTQDCIDYNEALSPNALRRSIEQFLDTKSCPLRSEFRAAGEDARDADFLQARTALFQFDG